MILSFRIVSYDIWQRCSKYSTCFSFHVSLLLFSSLKLDTENNVNFHAVSSKRANFDKVQCFKT